MSAFKALIVIAVLVSALTASEHTFTKTAPFNPLLVSGYDSCEANATNMIKQKALREYMGCESDAEAYKIDVTLVSHGDRSITLEECKVEATFSVTSEYLDENDYLIGSSGIICMGYDTRLMQEDTFWHSFELGVYAGFTGSQDSLEMKSSSSKIYYDYDQVLLYGVTASYAYKLLESQYVGAKLLFATASESYDDSTSTTKSRNDGDPSISRVGVGVYYGYRYHLKTELSAGLNYISDSVTRNYTNNSYDATVSTVNLELGAGYYVLPYMKLWGSLSSDVSASVGVSWVY